jgi:hypothetical protein
MRKALPSGLIFGVLVSFFSTANAELLLQPGFDHVLVGTVGGRTRAWGVGVADVNGGNIDDIVSGDTFGDFHLLTSSIGNGTFDDWGVVINRSFHDAYAVAVGDFDNDGLADFVAPRTAGSATPGDDGVLQLYLGNGDGTFQSSGFPQQGLPIGDAGTDAMVLAAADVDGDGDLDLVSGDITASENGRADVILFRNLLAENMTLSWHAEPVISAAQLGPDPEQPPYFPPTSYLQAYGLAFGDIDDDGDPDLLVGDRASYLYIYENDGTGYFSPVRYNDVPTRPFAFARLHETFASQMPLTAADFNGDGRIDIAAGGTDAQWEGQVDLWLNLGPDDMGRVTFSGAGIIGGAGTDARGLAAGQLNPSVDDYTDLVFGNYEGGLYGLFADLTDSDSDGIVDRFDNAPSIPNAPRIDMNTDGGINYLDQLDNDFDGVGDPADDDDDDDEYLDTVDNCPFTANPGQEDVDGDGSGDACDALNDTDVDGDGVPEGPTDPTLLERALQAKGKWASADTRFIIRLDALGRVFQNEFTQTLADGAILSVEEWQLKKSENYNGIGDAPADDGYNVPPELPGGMNVPITLFTIPKQIWNAFEDPDPVAWMNDRLSDPDLEIALHGTYHANNTPNGDWADDPNRNFYSCETCGLTLEENYQLLRIGQRTLLGEYDLWIQQSGADPESSPRIDWSGAANPLISYAPPFNTSDTVSRDAVARLGILGFSASIGEERNLIFSPEGSHHEQLDQFGMFHASADLQVNPEENNLMGAALMQERGIETLQKGIIYNWPHEESELPKGLQGNNDTNLRVLEEDAPEALKRLSDEFGDFVPVMPQALSTDGDYITYLESITEYGGLNTWLIEEVEWSTRYCNDLPRLADCPEAPGGINRENNMVDPNRWAQWLTLLQFANDNGVVMTMGDYALSMATDNCVGISNPPQTDMDADGLGDVCDIEQIDILPGSESNPVTLNRKGVIPVAILGTEWIDVKNVEVRSLHFGPGATSPTHDLEDETVYDSHLSDENGDGFLDLVSHYKVPETGIESGDTSACLQGLIAATAFKACDVITVRGR